MTSLSKAAAIVGIADTEVGFLPDRSGTRLCIEAILGAVEDAGLRPDQVDGLITSNSMVDPLFYHAEMIAEYMQIFPSMVLTVPMGGGTTGAAIGHAVAAIDGGVCENVVIAHADNLATGLSRERAIETLANAGHAQFEQPYGAPVPALYALIAQAHMHTYGTTAEQLARVAVSARGHAALHPGAQKRDPIAIEDVLNSPMIADPLHHLDCSLVSDGGGAIVLTSAERASDFSNDPVYVLGFGEGHSHEHISQARSLTTSAAVDSGQRAFAMAGLTPNDVDVAELYDCFTPVVIIELEDLGLCPKGEGGRFVMDGSIDLGGSVPVNTHGGLLSHSHPGNPGSMFHVTEAVRQLRGGCGDRQVSGAEVALVHIQGGIMSTHATLLLGSEATI